MVEILTSSSQTPSVDWLDVVVTGKARTRIRQRLRELGELHPRIDPTKKESHAPQPVPPPPRRPLSPRAARREVDDATRQKLVLVDGAGGVAVAFAKCCNPMPGEAIIGYATKGAGITVHRADCRNFAKSPRDPDRIIEVSWEGEEGFEVAMRVTLRQRPNILSDITNAIRPMNITISRAEFGSEENGASHFDFVFEAQDQQSVQRVSATIRTVSGVTNVVTMPAQTAPASASAAG
jgi:(p)ppGpp synthase/HD superfamily hydrolase